MQIKITPFFLKNSKDLRKNGEKLNDDTPSYLFCQVREQSKQVLIYALIIIK